MVARSFPTVAFLSLAACGGSQTAEPAPAPSPAPVASDNRPAPPPTGHPAEQPDPGTPRAAEPTAAMESDTPPVDVTPELPGGEPGIQRNPEEAVALLERGRQVQREHGEGGAEDAIALYEQAIAADPSCAGCFWELGWSKQLLTDWDGCVNAWDRVRELDPDFPELEVHYPVAVMRRDQAAAMAALPEPGDLPLPETEPRAGPTVTVNAVGDVHLGRAWPAGRAKLPPDDARDLLANFALQLQAEDITFGNLETALADTGDSTKCGPRSTKCFAFRVPTRFAEALAHAGFDVMSIANNHAGDFGDAGRQSTMKALDEVGIAHSGPIGDIASWETNGLKIGLVAFSTGGGVYQLQQIELAQKVIAEVDRTHDLVLVSFHGGAEGADAGHVPHGIEYGYGENRGDLRAFAHAVIDAGADLVIGHGPHRLRGMEIYRDRLIAYSLGNFSTWDTFSLQGSLGLTGVLRVTIAANGVLLRAELFPGIIHPPGRPHPDPGGRALDIVRDLSREDFGAPVLDEKGVYERPLGRT